MYQRKPSIELAYTWITESFTWFDAACMVAREKKRRPWDLCKCGETCGLRRGDRTRDSKNGQRTIALSVFRHVFGAPQQLHLPSHEAPHFAVHVVHVHLLVELHAPLAVITCCNCSDQCNSKAFSQLIVKEDLDVIFFGFVRCFEKYRSWELLKYCLCSEESDPLSAVNPTSRRGRDDGSRVDRRTKLMIRIQWKIVSISFLLY